MNRAEFAYLSRRERQILDVVYRLGEATAVEVHEALARPPAPATVRKLLGILEGKGHLRHFKRGRAFVYEPTVPLEQASQTALEHIVDVFFRGSPSRAAAALLGPDGGRLTDEEADELERLIERARKAES